MKKFLSMVLALVMAMSLVTISAGAADFADKDSIDYLEAVEVMTALGVVDGYTDGSFGPDGYLTRGAAAKIICNLILGPTTAEALAADAAPYSDVPTTNVFAGYIAYCQKEGIISGYADGTFRPGNSLTGYAFMKMLLGALGYDAATEGYTGNNWSINVAKQAINLELNKGLEGEFNGVNTVTRQEALLYAFNAIQCKMVEYPNNTTITVGDIKVETTASAKELTYTFAGKYFPTLRPATATDKYGRPATAWYLKNNKIGTYNDKADAIYTTDAKLYTVRQDLGLANNVQPVFTYVVNKTGETGTATLKYVNSTASNSNLNNMLKNDYSATLYDYAGRGVVVEFYYDADTQNNTIVVIEEQIAKVASVKKDDEGRYITLNGVAGKFYTEDFAKGDWVLYTVGVNATNTIASVEAAEKVTGTITWLTDSSNGFYFYVQIDGVAYYNHGANWMNTMAIGQEINAWLDSNGYIIKYAVTGAATATDKLVVVDDAKQDIWGTNIGKVIYADGTTETATLYTNYAPQDGVYNYTTSNGKLKLTSTNGYTSSVQAGTFNYVKGTPTMAGVKIDSATNFVYVDSAAGTVKTYVGYKNAPTFTGATKVIAMTNDTTNVATAVYVYVANSNLTNTSDDCLWLISDFYYQYTTTNSKGETISYYYVRTLDGSYVMVNADIYNTYLYDNVAWAYYFQGAVAFDSVTYDENGIIVAAVPAATVANRDTTNGYDVKESNEVLSFSWNGGNYAWVLTYAADVEVYVVANNGDSFYAEDIAGLEGTYCGFRYLLNDDGEVQTLVLKEMAN